MPQRIATKDYYAGADGKLTTEANAAILVARKGTALSDDTAARYGIDKAGEAEAYDAAADHEAKHGGETDAEAALKRTAMLEGVPDPDGPAVEGERGEKAKVATDNKAAGKAPANK